VRGGGEWGRQSLGLRALGPKPSHLKQRPRPRARHRSVEALGPASCPPACRQHRSGLGCGIVVQALVTAQQQHGSSSLAGRLSAGAPQGPQLSPVPAPPDWCAAAWPAPPPPLSLAPASRTAGTPPYNQQGTGAYNASYNCEYLLRPMTRLFTKCGTRQDDLCCITALVPCGTAMVPCLSIDTAITAATLKSCRPACANDMGYALNPVPLCGAAGRCSLLRPGLRSTVPYALRTTRNPAP
jgi:hypothetical protein